MKKLLKKVKNSKGFISLETLAVAVIVIALAAFIMFRFRTTAQESSDSVDSQIKQSVTDINTEAGTTSGANK